MKGDGGKAREILIELQDHAHLGSVSDFWLALVHAGLGEKDEAFANLQRAVEHRDSNLLYLFVAPRVLGLHEDPRFGDVLRSIGLSHLTTLL